jgi:predicted nuclease with TOPRIM domain
VSVPDPSIRALYARLEEVLGAEHADTLMTRLPPPPDELAKQADMILRFEAVDQRFKAVDQRFDHLEQRFDGLERRFERLEDRFDHLDQGMHHMFEMMQKQLARSTTVMVTAMTALTAIYGGMLVAFVA